MVNASAVVGHKGWLAGYQVAVDTGKSKLTKNNFCLGYSTGDFVLHTNVNDGQVFGGSVYQKVNPNLETAVNLGKPFWHLGNYIRLKFRDYFVSFISMSFYRMDC